MKLLHLSEKRRKEITSLSRKKGRVQLDQMLIEGWRSVNSALQAGAPLIELLLTEKVLQNNEIMRVVLGSACVVDKEVSLVEISEKAARLISSVESAQGIFAVAGIKRVPVDRFAIMKRIVALDGVQDPGNVGTIIRTAAWFGVEGILAGESTADFFNPKVIRSSMGGLWDVALARVTGFSETLEGLKASGAQLVCADLDGADLAGWRPAAQTVLVIGGEANGISSQIQKIVDRAVTISGTLEKKGTESLNAGIAAGIIMHHWDRFSA